MIDEIKNLNYQIKKRLRSKVDLSIDNKYLFVKNLREKGCHLEKKFNLHNSVANKILKNFKKLSKDKILEIINDAKSNNGRYNYRKYITHHFNRELLIEYANQKLFIDNFRQYFGLEPKIRFISVWLDFPTNEKKEKNSQIFHRDSDDIFLVKTFFCLTKINNENGPFQFIETSHNKPWDLNLEKYLNGENSLVRTFNADEGDMYIADTNGFHKGKLLETGYRVLLSVHYVSDKPRVGFLDKIIN